MATVHGLDTLTLPTIASLLWSKSGLDLERQEKGV